MCVCVFAAIWLEKLEILGVGVCLLSGWESIPELTDSRYTCGNYLYLLTWNY